MKSISHKPNLALDFDKSVEIAHILVSGFLKRKGIFNDQKELVENQLPRGVQPLSKEHALFLFHIITLDYGTRSARLYENGKLLFVQHPELFNPAEVLEMGIDKVRELVVNNIGARFPNEATLRWYQNSKKLLKEYDGDPRNIFRISSDAEDVFKRVREFRGLGRKTGALLLRAFSNLGFAKLENLDKVLVPVDIHDTRIAFFTHCVRGSQNPETYVKDYSRYVKCVSELWSETAKNADLDWLVLDRALWLLGSKGCAKEKHSRCPIKDFCIKGKPAFNEETMSRFLGPDLIRST